MSILSLLGIKTPASKILTQALPQKTPLSGFEIKNYLTMAEGVTEITKHNVTRYTNELIDFARTHNVKININRFDDDSIVLSLKRKQENARPSVVANFFKENDKYSPLSEKLNKTIDDAINNLIKQESQNT